VRMRLSSRHLSLASRVFRKTIDEQWTEQLIVGERPNTITTADWDAEAFLIVMNIIHGHHRVVPRLISLDLLGKIAIIVDFYECHEATEIYIDIWISNIMEGLPSSYGRECVLWLSVSWVFSRANEFEEMTALATKGCEGLVETMGLPLPDTLLCELAIASMKRLLTDHAAMIDSRRVKAVAQMLDVLDNLCEALCMEVACDRYSPDCSCMLLGSLTKQMYAKGLTTSRLNSPFHGYSVDWLNNTVSGFSSPTWNSRSPFGDINSTPHKCDLKNRIQPAIDEIMNSVKGITLGELQNRKDHALREGTKQ
jgi:hypothetical protein